MKKLHRISAFFLSVLMSIALLTSCGNNGAATPNASSSAISTTPSAIDTEQKVLRISIAASEQEKKDYEECIARFEEKHPDFTVDANYSSGGTWQEICDKLMHPVRLPM